MVKIKIILADDHSILRTGLKLLLNNESDLLVVGEAADGREVLHLLDRVMADVLIVDLSMPNMSGLECIKEIRSRGNTIKILVLTMYENEDYLREAMQSGALGYVEKNAVDTELFEAVRTIAKGQRYLSPQKAQTLLNSLLTNVHTTRVKDPYTILSYREREVLKYIARGHSMSQIAQLLCISVKTVDTHKTRMMDKLGYTEKTELVKYALENGMLSTEL